MIRGGVDSPWGGVRIDGSSATRPVPQAAYFREAVEEFLKKYEEPKKVENNGPSKRVCPVRRGRATECQFNFVRATDTQPGARAPISQEISLQPESIGFSRVSKIIRT